MSPLLQSPLGCFLLLAVIFPLHFYPVYFVANESPSFPCASQKQLVLGFLQLPLKVCFWPRALLLLGNGGRFLGWCAWMNMTTAIFFDGDRAWSNFWVPESFLQCRLYWVGHLQVDGGCNACCLRGRFRSWKVGRLRDRFTLATGRSYLRCRMLLWLVRRSAAKGLPSVLASWSAEVMSSGEL